MTDTVLQDLAQAVGERQVLVEDDMRTPFESDWTGRFAGRALAVVRPADAAQVAAVVTGCARHRVALVPQGGNTGLVGGGVPRGGEVVLSLSRLNDLGEVDTAAATVEAAAGVPLAALQAHARNAGLDAAVDFAARDAATVGGMVATDAGGLHALRHGTVRARVAGVEAVLADGTIVDRRSPLLKDNAGYDLPALLVGSEGTLGIVTRVRWRLVPLLTARVAVLVPLRSLEQAAELLGALRPRLPSLEAAEFFLDEGLELVLDHQGLDSPPFERSEVYLLLECAGRSDPTEELAEALGEAGVDDALVADSSEERERLWRFREGHSEAIGAAGVPHKLDVGVPLARLPEFARRVDEEVGRVAAGARVVLFGHLGDGNVHVNVLGPDPEDETVDEAVLRLAAACEGTISAEHGVGIAKARFLGLVRPPGEVRAMREIKRALDPQGILNPGVVLAPE